MLEFVKGSASYCLPDQLASKSLFGKVHTPLASRLSTTQVIAT
jgi:hypothetical protein